LQSLHFEAKFLVVVNILDAAQHEQDVVCLPLHDLLEKNAVKVSFNILEYAVEVRIVEPDQAFKDCSLELFDTSENSICEVFSLRFDLI
jgi:hypothetical protein